MITFAVDKASFAELKASMRGPDQVTLSADTWPATASSIVPQLSKCLKFEAVRGD